MGQINPQQQTSCPQAALWLPGHKVILLEYIDSSPASRDGIDLTLIINPVVFIVLVLHFQVL